ncbi:hypothetical protein [Tabrizicola sp.]|uniref:hypothetical protein n=1 Tax=Tabrizicola sp. TaxID=2005166 RepID=UPI003F3776C1
MQLTLELIDGAQSGATRAVDGSTPFTVGTRRGANWLLPGGTGLASVTIRRAPDGFRAEATGEVTIEGHAIADGTTVTLGHGSRIGIGGLTLAVTLTQDLPSDAGGRHPALGQPTISSILSDVTPGGDSAGGPLPGRSAEEWLESFTRSRAPAARADWTTLGAFGANADRPAALPDPLAKPLATYLPEDWDAPSDRMNRISQAQVSTNALAIGPVKSEPDNVKPLRPKGDIRPLLEAAAVQRGEVEGPPDRQLANAGAALRLALEGIARLETLIARQRTELHLTAPVHSEDPATLSAALLLSDPDGLRIQALAARITALEAAQSAFVEGARDHLAAVRQSLDPTSITAAVASRGGLADRLTPATRAWAEYRARFAGEAHNGASALSDKALARAIGERLDRQYPEESSH